ncbi:hypothetical protein FCM35_KLT13097 [Carex littledalei]|uniref:Uncharacterized protein n=1 Tax=Carex littledalei TaxID=544730 RepID=A0A833QP86_9POAL|nr:hypothetical protein FCM35_KLT13097 [Carex littledalei]
MRRSVERGEEEEGEEEEKALEEGERVARSVSSWPRLARPPSPPEIALFPFRDLDGTTDRSARDGSAASERHEAKTIPVCLCDDNGQIIHPQWNDCTATFSGCVHQNGYHIYLLEPLDNILGGGGFLWMSQFPNTLGDGQIWDNTVDLNEDVWDVDFDDDLTWTRRHLNENFNGGYGLMLWQHTLF